MNCRPSLAATLVATALLAAPAFAGDADCSYLEIGASSGKKAIDAELKALEKKLTTPPLSAWTEFHKLSGGNASLDKLKAQTLKLAQGGASLLLRDRTDKRLELTVTMDDRTGKRVLDVKQALAVGNWAVWVASNAKAEGHILALTCK